MDAIFMQRDVPWPTWLCQAWIWPLQWISLLSTGYSMWVQLFYLIITRTLTPVVDIQLWIYTFFVRLGFVICMTFHTIYSGLWLPYKNRVIVWIIRQTSHRGVIVPNTSNLTRPNSLYYYTMQSDQVEEKQMKVCPWGRIWKSETPALRLCK